MQQTANLSETPGLLMGWSATHATPHSFGYSQNQAPKEDRAAALTYNGEGHLMTIAPTGAGKGVSCVVPAILLHQGPIVVLDIKGENHAMTHRRRTAMGSKVVCVDPFGIVDQSVSDTEVSGFNLFDLLPYLADDHETACRSLADLLVSADGHKTDPFWRNAAVGVIAGLIDCYNGFSGPMRSISALIHDLNCAIPGTTRAGQITHKQDLASRLHAQPELHQALKGAHQSPRDIWDIFQEATLSYHWRPRPSDIVAIVEAAAKEAMAHKTFPMSADEERDALENVVARAVGAQHGGQQERRGRCPPMDPRYGQ